MLTDMMNKLFEKEGQSIFTFNKGDIIIRLRGADVKEKKYNDNLGVHVEVIKYTDSSYREPVEFIAVENNLIYVKYLCGCLKGVIGKARLEDFSEDWALFKIPDGLTLEEIL